MKYTPSSRRQSAHPVLVATILQIRANVHQDLTNACITVQPYDNDEFRLQQVESAVVSLLSLHARLSAQIAIANMMRK